VVVVDVFELVLLVTYAVAVVVAAVLAVRNLLLNLTFQNLHYKVPGSHFD
jgi:hypothetical protein